MNDTRTYSDPELGGASPKLCGASRGTRPSIDTDDFDAMIAAAERLARGPTRDLMTVSLIEQRALYAVAAVAGTALQIAADLVAASDNGMDAATVRRKLETLTDYVRALMQMEKPK